MIQRNLLNSDIAFTKRDVLNRELGEGSRGKTWMKEGAALGHVEKSLHSSQSPWCSGPAAGARNEHCDR